MPFYDGADDSKIDTHAGADLLNGQDLCQLHFGGQGTYSISAAGPGKTDVETLDGIGIAGSDEYFVYYGYLAEDEE